MPSSSSSDELVASRKRRADELEQEGLRLAQNAQSWEEFYTAEQFMDAAAALSSSSSSSSTTNMSPQKKLKSDTTNVTNTTSTMTNLSTAKQDSEIQNRKKRRSESIKTAIHRIVYEHGYTRVQRRQGPSIKGSNDEDVRWDAGILDDYEDANNTNINNSKICSFCGGPLKTYRLYELELTVVNRFNPVHNTLLPSMVKSDTVRMDGDWSYQIVYQIFKGRYDDTETLEFNNLCQRCGSDLVDAVQQWNDVHIHGAGGHNPLRNHLIENKQTVIADLPADLVLIIASYIDCTPIPCKTLIVGPTLTTDTIRYFPASLDRSPPSPSSPSSPTSS